MLIEELFARGLMIMLGDCDWRVTWTKRSDHEFVFVNKERRADGAWDYIDEWRFRRK
jgi:hypothetical protein